MHTLLFILIEKILQKYKATLDWLMSENEQRQNETAVSNRLSIIW